MKSRYGRTYRVARARVVAEATHCGRCGEPISDELPPGHMNKATADHIIPVAEGGPHTIENLVAVCSKCNSARGSKDWNWQPRPMVPGAEDW